MTDKQTVGVYDEQAEAYAARFGDEIPKDLIDFAALVPEGGAVLDFGCGPGGMAAWLAGQGFRVEAWDASPEMVRRAADHPGVTAREAVFDDLTEADCFDGVWASFSLLHARRQDLPRLISRIAAATRTGGAVYIGMKLGTGEHRDKLGRHYAYVTEDELLNWMEDAGLTIVTKRLGHGKGLAGTDDPFITVTARA